MFFTSSVSSGSSLSLEKVDRVHLAHDGLPIFLARFDRVDRGHDRPAHLLLQADLVHVVCAMCDELAAAIDRDRTVHALELVHAS